MNCAGGKKKKTKGNRREPRLCGGRHAGEGRERGDTTYLVVTAGIKRVRKGRELGGIRCEFSTILIKTTPHKKKLLRRQKKFVFHKDIVMGGKKGEGRRGIKWGERREGKKLG